MRTALPRLTLLTATCLLASACFDPATDTPPHHGEATGVVAIGQVQGNGARSPLEGREVTVEGVVTGNFARHMDGWFVQDTGDGDPATSDALFVLGEGAAAVRQGDLVRVRGRVVEHGGDDAGLTALRPLEVNVLGRGEAVAPVVLTAPPDDWEPLEGMLVRIDVPLTVSGHHELARRGVLVASFGERLRTPTEVAAPGAAAAEVTADNTRRSLLIDDARADEHPRKVWYLPEDVRFPRSGSVLEGVQGVLDQRWGRYRLQLTERPQLRPAPRPAPPEVPGDVRLAVLNLENLFNGDGQGGGFPTGRGARNPEELARQMARLEATIQALAPDIVAVMELENDGYGSLSSIAQLRDALGADWRFVDTGQGPGDDAIRVGLLYRAAVVRPVGAPAMLEGGPFGSRSRVPLAQAFRAGDGPVFTVVANHFKSKGCSEAIGLNLDQGDGQGCWNALRTDSARRLGDWLASDPTGSGSDLAAIVGDLNAYSQEDPIRTLREAGWHNPFDDIDGSYTYVFSAQAGHLDHVLLSPALAERMQGIGIWHSNADEVANTGYRADNGTDQEQTAWRSSDHDPILAGFGLQAR